MGSTPRTGLARSFRKNQTRAEELLWQSLRAKRLGGWKWRRQAPVGPYIVDFACFAARLVVEVDGGTHSEPEEIAYDRRRTSYLESKELRVLRLTNRDVFEEINEACDAILAACELRLPLS